MKIIKETRNKLRDQSIADATGVPFDTVVSHTTGRRKRAHPAIKKYFENVIREVNKKTFCSRCDSSNVVQDGLCVFCCKDMDILVD